MSVFACRWILIVPLLIGLTALPAAGRPAASPEPGRQEAAEAGSNDYRLAVGDKLRIDVYRDDHLSQTLQVRPDGKITMPLVGDLDAAGFTPLELRDAVTTVLRDYVTNPVVTVIVIETVPPVAYVLGEVGSPGTIALHRPVTVLQALAMAGGFREFANTRDIRILRRGSAGMTTLRFNYREALRGQHNPLYLRPGDTVIVP